jgi:GH15 family glucan-1,4-alpha-glucosidase
MSETVISDSPDRRVDKSVRAILRNQNANGSIVASPDFSQYHFCWLRDGSFCANALDIAGEHEASARFHRWVNAAVQGIASTIDQAVKARERPGSADISAMPPARFSLEGSVVIDDWPNFQIDGYGTWLWSLERHLSLGGDPALLATVRDSVTRVAHYLARFALHPCFDVWEEGGDAVHTSTLANIYGGLTAAATLLGDREFLAHADRVRDFVNSEAIRDGHFVKSSANDDIDASLIWLGVPFGVVDLADKTMSRTVELIESRLTLGGGIRRYPADVYYGSGSWPVLTASLGGHYLELGDLDRAVELRDWVTARFDSDGHLGEQFDGELRDPQSYYAWVARWGPPAKDLTWSHAMYVVLARGISMAVRGHEPANSVANVASLTEGRADGGAT